MSTLLPKTVRPASAPPTNAVGRLGREVAQFGVVGALAFVVDNGGYRCSSSGCPVLRWVPWRPGRWRPPSSRPELPRCFRWVGNRFWTSREQRRDNAGHELALFVLVNVVGIAITAGAVWSSRNLLGLESVATDNLARIGGWTAATMLRFVAYRRYVFVAGSS